MPREISMEPLPGTKETRPVVFLNFLLILGRWRRFTYFRAAGTAASPTAWPSIAMETFSGPPRWGGLFYNQYLGYLGTVFELSPPSQTGGQWTKTTLYSFTSPGSGYRPDAPVVVGTNGILYGTTISGYHGPSSGDVFQLSPPSIPGEMWSESVLHSFYGSYGGSISGPVAVDTKGNLYGTTINNGDTTDCKGGCGTIFKLLPPASPGGAWGAGWTIKLNGANGQFADGDSARRA